MSDKIETTNFIIDRHGDGWAVWERTWSYKDYNPLEIFKTKEQCEKWAKECEK